MHRATDEVKHMEGIRVEHSIQNKHIAKHG